MKHYEMDIQGRELCERHGKLRCDECAYIAELEDRIDHMKDVGATNIEYMRELEWRKERYEKALEFILSIEKDEDFDQYAYMMLEIMDEARTALKEDG